MVKILHTHTSYIVPFMFEVQGKESFGKLVKKTQSNPDWYIYNPHDSKEESDLYSVILDGFVMNDVKKNNIGCIFDYKPENVNDISFYYTKLERDFLVSIDKVKIFLFRTGVGFFWYEAKLPKEITVNELIAFQNEFKELSYERFLLKDKRRERYIFEINHEKKEGLLMGDWINNILSSLSFKYRYFAERKNPLDNKEMIADKALLYNYVVFDELSDSFWEDTYRIANGYNRNYMIRHNVESKYIEFFQHAYCYASMGGTGYYVVPVKENKGFYMGTFSEKIKNDYFLLNIFVLYQSYTLLKITEKMGSELSAISEDYLEESEEILEELQKIETEINVFLMKGVYSLVSHIGHHNEYYEYLIRKFRIKKNIEGLTIGLESVQKLQQARKEERMEMLERQENMDREKLNDRLNVGLGLLSVLAILSALADGFSVIDVVMEWWGIAESRTGTIRSIILVLVIGLGMYVVKLLVQSISRLRKSRKSSNISDKGENKDE